MQNLLVNKKPLVSVIMSVYNGENIIEKSIYSILNQTFEDFEILVVNDGSTDATLKILKNIQDKRLKIISQNTNIGLTKSLNIAINNSNGYYLARQDADDISFPNRLEKQVNYFEENPKLNLLGTRAYIWLNGKRLISKNYENEDLIYLLQRNNIFIHSTIMLKKETFLNIGCYNEKYKVSQDYEAWLKLLDSGYNKLYIYPDILVERNIDEFAISTNRYLEQAYNGFILRKKRIPFILNFYFFLYQFIINFISINISYRFNKILKWGFIKK